MINSTQPAGNPTLVMAVCKALAIAVLELLASVLPLRIILLPVFMQKPAAIAPKSGKAS